MKKTDNTVMERMKRYRDAQKERGMIKMTVWVPENHRDALKAYAKKLRKKKK